MDRPGVIVFFDAECLLCNRSVRWLLEADREGRLSFAPLSGETARDLRAEGVLDDEHLGGGSMVLAERSGGEWSVLMRSDAVLRALEISGAATPGRWFLKMLPRFLRDWGYRLVARTRYAVFGKTDECLLPDERTAGRILP